MGRFAPAGTYEHVHHHRKGTTVTPTEPIASTASTPKAGRFGALGGLCHIKGSGTPARRCSLAVVSLLATMLGALLFSTAPALAANGHAFSSSFGGEKSTVKDAEPLSDPTGIAVSDKTGEIYVIDSGHDRVERFSSTGAPEGEFESPAGGFSEPNAIAVDNDPSSASYGDIYVSDSTNDAIDKYDPEGKYSGFQLTEATTGVSLTQLRGVAVDPSGILWVYDNYSGGVYEFAKAATNEFTVPAHEEIEVGTEASGIAIDSQDNLYLVGSYSRGEVEKWAPGRIEVAATPFEGFCACTGVAVDPSTNNVYVDHQGLSVGEYAPFGESLNENEPIEPPFGTGTLQGGTGIAVSATGTVYVADATANDVAVFEEGPRPTTPVTEPAEPVEGVSATFKGKLEGGEDSYHFAYNSNGTCTGGSTTPSVATTGTESVSAKITGLVAKTKYTYCLLDENKYGQESGSAETFETRPSAPFTEKTSASVHRVEVALEGTVNPELEASSCVFQYGTTEAYGQEVPCAPGALGEVGVGVTVKAILKGLVPVTAYDYRILATNPTGTQPGPNESFTTEVITPTDVETAPAAGVTPTTAVFGGQANPGGSASYYIEYGSPTCSLYGVPNFAWWLCAAKTAEAGPIRGDSTQTVAPIEVTGLTPGTTYRYWVVAHNASGSERGEEATFTTPTATASAVGGSAPTPPASTVVPAPKPPVVKPPPKRRSAAQEKAERLSRALKQCEKTKSKTRRKTCVAQARQRYGPKTRSKPKSGKRGH